MRNTKSIANIARLRLYAVAIALLLAALISFTATNALAAWQTPGTTDDISQQQTTPAPGLTTSVSEPYYKTRG